MLKFLFSALLASSFEPKVITPYPVVGYQEAAFSDEIYKVYRNVLIWYPVDDALIVGQPPSNPWDLFNVAENAPIASPQLKKPVIIISHGYSGNPHQLSWLIRGLTYHGFIVIGIQHLDLVEGQVHINHWQRAKDVSMILDQFAKHLLAASADLNKIGIAGFSLGGTTAIWVTGGRANRLDQIMPGPEHASQDEFSKVNEALPTLDRKMMAKDWRDRRIKAAFLMAPAWAWLFDEASLRTIIIPTYLIAASADQVLVSRNNAGFFARHIPRAIYQEIKGKASHFIFISALNERQRTQVDPKGELTFLYEDDATIDRNWIQVELIREAVNFFKATL